MPENEISAFDHLADELVSHSIDLHPSELHGMLVGYACAVKDATRENRNTLYAHWLGTEPPASTVALLEAAYSGAVDNLDEFADFGFRLLMPTEDLPIDERVRALAHWCSGFLSGMGESGRTVDSLTGDAAEALTDLARIAAMTDDVPESEDNEEDLAEIEEFVRVSVLLVFSETHVGPTH